MPPPQQKPSLPIIERFIQIYKLWHEFVPHVPKTARYTLGSKIDALFVETIEQIFIAGYLPRDKKLPYIQNAIVKSNLVKFFLRVAWEIKALDTKKYALLSEYLDEIGRMLGGWNRQFMQ